VFCLRPGNNPCSCCGQKEADVKHEGVYLPEKLDESSLKDKIFTSAIALFAEYGLNGARMEQIAEKAGTTKRMVVYHFKTKETLYLQVLE